MSSAPYVAIVDFDDEFTAFFRKILPSLVVTTAEECLRLSVKRKGVGVERPPRSKKFGRRWQQRKTGEMRPNDFVWWRLIHKPDVGDLKSRNGKV